VTAALDFMGTLALVDDEQIERDLQVKLNDERFKVLSASVAVSLPTMWSLETNPVTLDGALDPRLPGG
jgi:hypothetical protein